MGNAYSKSLRNHFENSLNLKPVIAASVDSLHLNSFHEGLFASNLSADILLNGIVPEVIVARHCGIQCAAFCVIEHVISAEENQNQNQKESKLLSADAWIHLFSAVSLQQ
jgi:purine nucleoside phosphorylase